jgi:hypothetical protein
LDEDSDKTHLVGNNSFLSQEKMKSINEVKEVKKMIIKGGLRGRKSHGSVNHEYSIAQCERGRGFQQKNVYQNMFYLIQTRCYSSSRNNV